ncbi:PepSY domain-containing protein [Helcococcus sueciensis]|uniref:PepSY domain-containing protein n=1 Tax=Helcococcus sueciensis TaxID=241555 RepID=UPI00041589F3|nr:PepSY domain-containing protein [Helcococcus sueciensis]
MMKKIKLGTLLLSGVLVLAACSNGTQNQTETKLETATETKVESSLETETNDNTQNQSETAKVTINRAVEIFYEKFGDKEINITQIDFDKDDGKYTYEIEGWKDNKEYKLEIDAETENILEQKSEADDDIDKDDISISLDKIVSPEKAIEEALKQAKANNVEGWDLHTDDGVLVYEVDVKDGEDVIISANDGSFIKFD